MSKFGRNDIKDFIRNFKEASWSEEKGGFQLLSECGCEYSPAGLYDDTEIVMGDPILPETFQGMQSELAAAAPCPDSYNVAADLLVTMPHELVEMLKPLMQDLGIGCPASLAKAMGDVLTVSQEHGVTPIFNTEEPSL
tara:strand:- start:37 stop:450 length:414 start_codon:yes stop_codon:yes gene_type:complete